MAKDKYNNTPMQWFSLLLAALLPCCMCTFSLTVVIDLNEKFLDVSDEGFWMVKFYAPWCAHCKRLLPVWEHLAHAVSDKNLPVRVAKMDCTRFTSACNKLSITGYPTVVFFRQGRRIEYLGERTKEALFNFVVKSSAPIVEKVNAARISDIRRDSRNDPAFIIIGDEKNEMYEEFGAIADKLFSKTRFFATSATSAPSSLVDSGARVAVFKDDAFFPYHGTVEGLRDWIFAERWPLMPLASASNLADIASGGKLIVLVICTELERFNQSSPIGVFCEKARGAAEDLRKSEYLSSRFQFAWTDGPELASSIVMGHTEPPGMQSIWSPFLYSLSGTTYAGIHHISKSQCDLVELPSILVLNYTTYEYYVNDDEPQNITRASIVTWLSNLADNLEKGTAAALGGRSFPVRLRRMFFEVYSNVAQMFSTQPLLSSVLFGMPIAFLSIICYRSSLSCLLLAFVYLTVFGLYEDGCALTQEEKEIAARCATVLRVYVTTEIEVELYGSLQC